mmetsp:Transcript_9855/g.36092  ORF Transcript_9855/g.36092 Transcript_9855/m.36092 type:complete len:375 (+) Transcript_9855:30-1154(+)
MVVAGRPAGQGVRLSSRNSVPRLVLVAGALIRLILIAYGIVQDRIADLKYTDIDYAVFSDAARLLVQGLSPYDRPTYRYPPLLAALLAPVAAGWSSFGKLLFACADLHAGCTLYDICRQDASHAAATLASCSWLLNPIVINISTRGNCDSLVVAGVLSFVRALQGQRLILAALLLGLMVHFRLFPIIYALPCFVYLGCEEGLPFRFSVSRRQLTFAFVSGSAFVILGALSYAAYGNEFIQHSYVYHLSRKVTSAWCPSRRDMMPVPSPVSNFFRITGTTSHPASTYHTWRTMEISRTSSSIALFPLAAYSFYSSHPGKLLLETWYWLCFWQRMASWPSIVWRQFSTSFGTWHGCHCSRLDIPTKRKERSMGERN